MIKFDSRAFACEEAKRLAKKAGNGAKPNEFMKEAWALAKIEKEKRAQAQPVTSKKISKAVQEMAERIRNVKAPIPREKAQNWFAVEYRSQTIRKSQYKTIVLADSKEEAIKMFNNPADPFGPKNLIVSCAKAKKIPSGWDVEFKKNASTIQVARITKDIPLTGEDIEVKGFVKDKEVIIKASDILGATFHKDTNVLNAGQK